MSENEMVPIPASRGCGTLPAGDGLPYGIQDRSIPAADVVSVSGMGGDPAIPLLLAGVKDPFKAAEALPTPPRLTLQVLRPNGDVLLKPDDVRRLADAASSLADALRALVPPRLDAPAVEDHS